MNDWSLDGRGRRVFARLDVMRSVNQCAERALRGKAGLLARLEAHGVSNRQAARIIRVSGQAFGSWWCRGRWPDCYRVAQAFALLADGARRGLGAGAGARAHPLLRETVRNMMAPWGYTVSP